MCVIYTKSYQKWLCLFFGQQTTRMCQKGSYHCVLHMLQKMYSPRVSHHGEHESCECITNVSGCFTPLRCIHSLLWFSRSFIYTFSHLAPYSPCSQDAVIHLDIISYDIFSFLVERLILQWSICKQFHVFIKRRWSRKEWDTYSS